MTAYISRLFSPSRPAGIRPRPRSRYEPDPETYLSADPIEAHVQTESGMDHRRAGPIAPEHALQRPAPRSTDGPQSRTGSAESVAAVVVSTSGPPALRQVAAEHTNPPAPPQRSAAPFELDHGDPHPDGGRQEPAPAPDVWAWVVPPEGVPAAAPPISDVPAGPVAAGRPRQTGDVAVAAPPLTGPPPVAEGVPVESTHVPVPHRPAPPAANSGIGTPPRVVSVTGPAAPSAAEPPHAVSVTGQAAPSAVAPTEPDNAQPGPATQDLIAAAVPARATGATHINNSPDPVVRQTIINAITELAHEQITEVVVHIDRIDVRAPASSPPPPVELRRARAAPTSLQAYLRSQSRRAGT